MVMEQMETSSIIQSVKNWNPYCEHITLSTIFSKLRVGDNESFCVINWGSPGTGKSYSSLTLSKELNLGTDIIIDNNTTKRGLFELLAEFPNYDFILDECSALMQDKGTQDMLKLAIERKPLNWVKKDSHETTPVFTGNFIFNVNHALLDSLTDRCFVNLTLMNKRMALDFVDYYLGNRPEMKEFIIYLRRLLSTEMKVELTKEEMDYVKDFTRNLIETNEENLGYSRRTIIRMVSYFKRVKRLFRKTILDEEVKSFIEPYAAIYIENKRTPTVIETLLGDAKMDKIALIRLVASETGYSIRHARRLIGDELAKGKLQQFGRQVYVA